MNHKRRILLEGAIEKARRADSLVAVAMADTQCELVALIHLVAWLQFRFTHKQIQAHLEVCINTPAEGCLKKDKRTNKQILHEKWKYMLDTNIKIKWELIVYL